MKKSDLQSKFSFLSAFKCKMDCDEDKSNLSSGLDESSEQIHRSTTLRWATFDDLLDDALEEGKLSPTRFKNLNKIFTSICSLIFASFVIFVLPKIFELCDMIIIK